MGRQIIFFTRVGLFLPISASLANFFLRVFKVLASPLYPPPPDLSSWVHAGYLPGVKLPGDGGQVLPKVLVVLAWGSARPQPQQRLHRAQQRAGHPAGVRRRQRAAPGGAGREAPRRVPPVVRDPRPVRFGGLRGHWGAGNHVQCAGADVGRGARGRCGRCRHVLSVCGGGGCLFLVLRFGFKLPAMSCPAGYPFAIRSANVGQEEAVFLPPSFA